MSSKGQKKKAEAEMALQAKKKIRSTEEVLRKVKALAAQVKQEPEFQR
jgi:hypothetical protein